MEPVHPAFVPRSGLSRTEMEGLQRDVAAVATFEDDLGFDPGDVGLDRPVEEDPGQAALDRAPSGRGPVVAGVDQAFLDEEAVSAVVAIRDGEVVSRAHAVEPLSIPYVPGLLSFREGGPILAAFGALDVEPDLVLFDGSGRIHYREAGLATHLGVVLDVPSLGVAKRLLCGEPRGPVDALEAGERVAITADEQVEDAGDEVLGYAVQTRQFEDSRRINPVYVSPGHRVGASTAADLALALSSGYKLPEPTRLADRHVGKLRDDMA